ncbi:uncharacterized protein RSE6_14882 [Rhynchosporium secalis]|uniref:Erythromycin biosynthesis protein CIII-like C-terminal domain-containing protein n=1 Tax=Rhynchosporium secalis TaxID=38038 RepID=A0A1E1MWC3_RHYSE|nr:uncharacterized protein RSE6_14882 [Rhynchosporium secalis]
MSITTIKSSIKPHILYAVPPREGHMRPALQIATHLISHSFSVTIISTPSWRIYIESIGAKYAPIIGRWNTLDDYRRWPKIAFAETGEERLRASLAGGFVGLLVSGWMSVRGALEEMRVRSGGDGEDVQQLGERMIVVLSDTCFSGTLALKLGADLPAGLEGGNGMQIKTLGIGVVPVYWADALRPPWGSGVEFDGSEEGKLWNLAAHERVWDQQAEEMGREVLEMLSCTRTVDELYEKYRSDSYPDLKRPFWDATTVCHDATLQMCLPNLEYPAMNWPEHVNFVGPLPIKPLPGDLVYPEWFEEVRRSGSEDSEQLPERRKVILVAQGTESLDYNDLVIPTIRSLANHPSVLVIAILCVKGAFLSPTHFAGNIIPSNARIIDYFPYDAVLAHADAFVSSSGYGGLTHAIGNGVPMVQAGKNFDKPDIGRRIERCGLGLFLPDMPLDDEELTAAVLGVLREERFRERALELKEEAGTYRALERVEKEILTLVEEMNQRR